MKWNRVVWFMGALALGATIPQGFALESNAKPVALTSTATPPVTSTDGSINTLELTSQTPHLTFTGTDGHSLTLEIERSTTVLKSGQSFSLNQLKAGERIRVRHMRKRGREVVKSIEAL